MSRYFLDQGRQLLATVLNKVQMHTIAFYRDETDSFALEILPSDPNTKPLSPSLISKLLPAGSQWRFATGWRSFSCVPLKIDTESFLCIGIEGVIPHSERGAFPEYYGFVVKNTSGVVPLLSQIAERISGDKSIEIPSWGIVTSKAETPEGHKPVEAALIRKTSENYANGAYRVLKTALLSEANVSILSDCLLSTNFLVGVIPSIRSHFSPRIDRWLKWQTERGR